MEIHWKELKYGNHSKQVEKVKTNNNSFTSREDRGLCSWVHRVFLLSLIEDF